MTDAHPAPRRTAVVTGAARGIGAAIAARLALQGNDVAILDLPRSDASAVLARIEQAGGSARFFATDVTDEADVARAIDAVGATFDPPSILVNNAGITRDSLLFKMSLAEWESVIAVHLRGAFLMTRAVEAGMRAGGWGRIVNLSSTSAEGNRGQANYSAAKAGVVGFTRTVAAELGRYGVTCNAVAPGFIDTEMLRATADRLNVDFEVFSADATARIPLRTIGRPDDVAATVCFLAGDDAQYITGELIRVSGGFRG
jgi:3-oxoacyl-[acyl-carrier protein] reductase